MPFSKPRFVLILKIRNSKFFPRHTIVCYCRDDYYNSLRPIYTGHGWHRTWNPYNDSNPNLLSARGMFYPFITKVDFTDNIHQGQNRSHSKYFWITYGGQKGSLRISWTLKRRPDLNVRVTDSFIISSSDHRRS